jgi:hypothetical protein
MISARYVNQLRAEVPVVKQSGGEIRLYAGRLDGIAATHGSGWPMTLMDIRAEAGAELALDVPAGDRGFLHLLAGEARIGAQQAKAVAGDVAWFEPSLGDGFDRLVLAADAPLRALLYSSAPIDEPVVARGPFVMNSNEEIVQAYTDYRSGRFVA